MRLDLAVDLAVLIPASVWPIYPTASSTHTGTWSEGFSQLRVNLSIPAACIRSVACGDIRMWSMRMPWSFCQAPAW
jgi:hypothetical protein